MHMTTKTNIFSVSLIAIVAVIAATNSYANIVGKTYVDNRLDNISLLEGPQGEIGAQGPQGEVGVQGPQGLTGAQGLQGEIGAQGSQGIAGADGAQGPQGADGAQGPQGDTGSVSSVVTTGSGYIISDISGTSTLTVTKSNVQIPFGSENATTYATIWVE